MRGRCSREEAEIGKIRRVELFLSALQNVVSPIQINSAAGFPLSDRQRRSNEEKHIHKKHLRLRHFLSHHSRVWGSPALRGLRMNKIHLSMHHMLGIGVFAAVLNISDSIRLKFEGPKSSSRIKCLMLQDRYITTIR